jgi:NAD(P)-dependent dehydrogenase (short-subunit alcohol dehydrogenase family)
MKEASTEIAGKRALVAGASRGIGCAIAEALSEEVASAVLMLVQNAYVTGQTLQVNGGFYLT